MIQATKPRRTIRQRVGAMIRRPWPIVAALDYPDRPVAALFVSLEGRPEILAALPGMDGHEMFVLRFRDKAAATRYALERLVEAGEAEPIDATHWRINGGRITDAESALMEWQQRLGSSEYFHVYDCRDVDP